MRTSLLLAPLLLLLLVPTSQATALGSYVFGEGETYAGHETRPGLVLINHTTAGQSYLELQSPVATLVALNISTPDGTQLRVVATQGTDDAVLAALLDAQAATESRLARLQTTLTQVTVLLNATAKTLNAVADTSTANANQSTQNAHALAQANATLQDLAGDLVNVSQQLTDISTGVQQVKNSGREHQELATSIEATHKPAPKPDAKSNWTLAWPILVAILAGVALLAWRRRTKPAPAPEPVPVEAQKPRTRRIRAPKPDAPSPSPVLEPPAPEPRHATPQEVEAILRRNLGLDAKGGPT